MSVYCLCSMLQPMFIQQLSLLDISRNDATTINKDCQTPCDTQDRPLSKSTLSRVQYKKSHPRLSHTRTMTGAVSQTQVCWVNLKCICCTASIALSCQPHGDKKTPWWQKPPVSSTSKAAAGGPLSQDLGCKGGSRVLFLMKALLILKKTLQSNELYRTKWMWSPLPGNQLFSSLLSRNLPIHRCGGMLHGMSLCLDAQRKGPRTNEWFG